VDRGFARLIELMPQERVKHAHVLVHRGETIECRFVARDVPGLGYRAYSVLAAEASETAAVEPQDTAIETEALRVEVAQDGTFTLLDKRTGATYPGLNRFVDEGDRGDEYNFCPVEEDLVVAKPVEAPQVCLVESGAMRQTLEVAQVYRVPASLGETRHQRSDESVELAIKSRISLTAGVPRVEVQTTVENRAADHRLRVHFPVPVQVDAFETEGHMDVIRRPLDLPTDTENWVEQPIGTHPQRTWADVSDGDVGLLLANRGLPEVEALRAEGGSELALTLLRCVGSLSRADLSVRRGHAGPGLPTPEAQCLDEYTFHYALVPHPGDWRGAYAEAHAFNAPLRAVPTFAHAGSLPLAASYVEVTPSTMAVSAVKEAEDGEGLIVRMWNVEQEPCECAVRFWKTPQSVTLCNLGERVQKTLRVDGEGTVRIPARGREIVTLRARF
jgi:alpha-mannosidase